jgi:hypothetical protein
MEHDLWSRAEDNARYIKKLNGVGSNTPSVSDIPRILSEYGCNDVNVDFLAVTYIPDNANQPFYLKKAIIESDHQTAMDSILVMAKCNPSLWTDEEILLLKTAQEQRFMDRMTALHEGRSVWDIRVSMLMIVTGKK